MARDMVKLTGHDFCSGDEFARLLSTTDAFVTSTVSALGNQTWPFVVVPDFAARAAKTLPLSPAFQFDLTPLVKSDQFDEWIEFANENDAWV